MIGSDGVALASAGLSGFFSPALGSAIAEAGDGDSAGTGELTGDGSGVALLAAASGLLVSFCVLAFSVAGPTRRTRADIGVGDAAGFAGADVFRFGVVFWAIARLEVNVDTIARATSVLRILIDKNFLKRCGRLISDGDQELACEHT